jgi:hypothetical protein
LKDDLVVLSLEEVGLGLNEPSFPGARRRHFFLVSELMKRKVSHGQNGDRKNNANQL